MSALTPLPPTLAPAGALQMGLWAGALDEDPAGLGPRHGRLRRWSYAAAADEAVAAGAAVVDLGYAGTAFAWVATPEGITTWERTVPLGVGVHVGSTPRRDSTFALRRDRLVIRGDGSFSVQVGRGRDAIQVDVTATSEMPAVLATTTPDGGWNVTEKAAGYPASGSVSAGGEPSELEDAGGWRDWTTGRQDRRTTWRWVAGAGRTSDGRRVGINGSTGMNGLGAGENVLWVEGRPEALDLRTLAPANEDPAGTWDVGGPDWSLTLVPWSVRAADENYVVVRSRYAQPVGPLQGRLPVGDSSAAVSLTGVTELHEARW